MRGTGDGGGVGGGGGNGDGGMRGGAANAELMEMRDAIIHCDGGPGPMRSLAALLAHDLPALTVPALKFVMECVQELPVKTPVYATLVGLLNARVPEFVEEVVRTAIEHLEASLKSFELADRIRSRLLLRFIAILPAVGVIEPSAALEVLDAVVCAAVAAADAAEPGWQPRADFLIYIALAAMPWAGATLSSATEANAGEIFDVLMGSIEDYLARRTQGPDPAAMVFSPAAGSPAGMVDDWLEELWGRVNEVRKAGKDDAGSWTVKSVPPVMAVFAPDIADAGGDRHVPPPLAVPEMSFSGPAEALATFPVRPRLR
jgi:nuclear cap-binding protein subunit 1